MYKTLHVVNESSKTEGYIINIKKTIVLYIRHESENLQQFLKKIFNC